MKLIDMPHHVSVNHPQMSMMQRAAQFAPFAALTGYEEKIKEIEKARETSTLASEKGHNLEYWDFPEDDFPSMEKITNE